MANWNSCMSPMTRLRITEVTRGKGRTDERAPRPVPRVDATEIQGCRDLGAHLRRSLLVHIFLHQGCNSSKP